MTTSRHVYRVMCVNPATGRVIEFLLEAPTEVAAKWMAESVGLKHIVVKPESLDGDPPERPRTQAD